MTTDLPVGQFLGLTAWESTGEDYLRRRLEVSEGVLCIAPRSLPEHHRAMTRLVTGIDEQLPPDRLAFGDVDVLLWESPLTVRVPNMVIVPADRWRSGMARFAAADVVLALEILSPGTRRTDRVTKFSEYAEAGIRQYWLVDLDAPATLSAYTLAGDGYEADGEFTGTVTLDVHGAGTVTVDLDALTADRPQRPEDT